MATPPSTLFDFGPRTAPWTKLCGVRDVSTAEAVAELRPHAIGLNFYPPSLRFVTLETAAEVRRALPAEVAAVGVFVNAAVEELLRTAEQVGLTAVQLHGDEPAEVIAELKRQSPNLAVIRAWRVGPGGLAALSAHLADCRRTGAMPDAVLVDAKVAGEYGGTGRTAPWDVLRDYDPAWPPLILAGGLTPVNVAAAIAAVRPWGVDTAGGVESSPGVKDRALAAAFLTAARAASPPSAVTPDRT